jgi:hypothetical protein
MKRGSKHTEEARKKMGTNLGKHFSDEHRKNMSVAMLGKKRKPFSEKSRENMAAAHRGKKRKPFSDTHRKNISKSRRGKLCGDKNPMYGVHICGENNPMYGTHLLGWKNGMYGKHHSYKVRMKIIESRIGGFWYGAVRYKDRIYCELWCPDLWHRIDEAQNYQSILSGKTKEDNICRNGKTRALFRHHVYWQPRVCCEWDEDAQGYYAWIETGTPKHPNKVKYYIKGDPNKFVLLTAREHGLIAKDKIKWIKIFEDLIETKLGGVCFLPKGVE